VACYRRAVAAKPDAAEALNSLAWRLAVYTQADFHDPQKAVELAEKACTLVQYRSARLMDTLAVAYASTGRYDRAQDTANKALQLCQSSPQQADRAKAIQARLKLYVAGQPYVEVMPVP
jgi:tetratricopeptide (TPR) repeat protein